MSAETGAAQQLTPEEPPRTGKKWKLALAGLIGVYVVLAGFDLISNSSALGLSAASSASAAPRTAAPALNEASTTPQSATAGSAPAPAPTPSTATRAAARPLDVASITAFGPGGTSDGDNPGTAFRILDVDTDQPWYSQWYATPKFGNLKPGTGLLLDMGKSVTVSSVQLALGSQVGAAMQVRVGDTASLADLSTVATATDVGGTVRLSAATRVSGRYVLIWFTALPPNGQGEYQVSVYDVTVDGTLGT